MLSALASSLSLEGGGDGTGVGGRQAGEQHGQMDTTDELLWTDQSPEYGAELPLLSSCRELWKAGVGDWCTG